MITEIEAKKAPYKQAIDEQIRKGLREEIIALDLKRNLPIESQ
ncbi:hypothetical protein ACFPCW_25665 [Vibrio thalassae]